MVRIVNLVADEVTVRDLTVIVYRENGELLISVYCDGQCGARLGLPFDRSTGDIIGEARGEIANDLPRRLS